MFFFDRLNAGTLLLAERFRMAGSLVVFEPAQVGQPGLFRRAIAAATIVKYSEEWIEDLDEYPTSQHQVRVSTRGAGGACYRVGHGSWHSSPAYPYPVIDAGGAGDWTTAGLIHALSFHEPTTTSVGEALRSAYRHL